MYKKFILTKKLDKVMQFCCKYTDQVRLNKFAMELSNKGIKLMISNSDTSFIRELYKDFNISTITIKYPISNYRRTSNEVLITNYV
ncbi:DNA adenine methylase [Candidatus Tisiphia endosymbiont of Mystacides longicornis]|uniref:DNA adenine methylase n=1 Tax=Candidatus Tisiphia endosymbiont of Mystacides longicornis TaxID=3139330 RepID=UPI003CCAF055